MAIKQPTSHVLYLCVSDLKKKKRRGHKCLWSATRIEKWLFSSDSKQVQLIELRRQKAETLSIGLVFSWKLTRSCVTQSSQDETEDWSLSTSLAGRLSCQAPLYNMYQARSIMDQCCNTVAFSGGYQERSCEIMRVQDCVVISWWVKIQRSRWQKKRTFQHYIRFFPLHIAISRLHKCLCDHSIVWDLLCELSFRWRKFLAGLGGAIMQILNSAVARARALSWHFNGLINRWGQLPVRIPPVWCLHYLAHGATRVSDISSGCQISQISFSVRQSD